MDQHLWDEVDIRMAPKLFHNAFLTAQTNKLWFIVNWRGMDCGRGGLLTIPAIAWKNFEKPWQISLMTANTETSDMKQSATIFKVTF